MTRRLGKGLAQILETSGPPQDNLALIGIDQIRPFRHQPRQTFDGADLEALKASIKAHGIVEPLLVRPIAHGTYELIAGERRWRAAQALGIQEVPAIVRALSDQEALEVSLIENLQRKDLNPLEEAGAFDKLIREFEYTQEQLAETLGKDRSTIANALRLLQLPEDIQAALRRGALSAGHAKVLAGIEPQVKQLELLRQAVAGGWSVRQLEVQTAQWRPKASRRRWQADPQLKTLEDGLRKVLATKVSLTSRRKGGRIVIEYFSSEDLERLLHVLGMRT